jgi:hypothetical protein
MCRMCEVNILMFGRRVGGGGGLLAVSRLAKIVACCVLCRFGYVHVTTCSVVIVKKEQDQPLSVA